MKYTNDDLRKRWALLNTSERVLFCAAYVACIVLIVLLVLS